MRIVKKRWIHNITANNCRCLLLQVVSTLPHRNAEDTNSQAGRAWRRSTDDAPAHVLPRGITWVTSSKAAPLLEQNPFIERLCLFENLDTPVIKNLSTW